MTWYKGVFVLSQVQIPSQFNKQIKIQLKLNDIGSPSCRQGSTVSLSPYHRSIKNNQ